MIITDKFVILNFPKTGSTFVRKVLKELHTNYPIGKKLAFRLGIQKKPLFQILRLPSIRNSHRESEPDEHGIYHQIPEEHKNKIIVSIKRDLFARYVSIYNYGNWRQSPWTDSGILKNEYPNFPDITFKEFVYLWNKFNPLEKHHRINKKLPVGPATSQFILFFFKNPFEVLNKIDEVYVDSDAYKEDIADVIFLDQTNLNQELYDFLNNQNYKESEIRFIINAEKENVSTSDSHIMKDFYDEELVEFIKKSEYFLLRIMREYKIDKTATVDIHN